MKHEIHSNACHRCLKQTRALLFPERCENCPIDDHLRLVHHIQGGLLVQNSWLISVRKARGRAVGQAKDAFHGATKFKEEPPDNLDLIWKLSEY
jgi:hypothetical protein